jgi:hypothetical protein
VLTLQIIIDDKTFLATGIEEDTDDEDNINYQLSEQWIWKKHLINKISGIVWRLLA